MIRERYKAYKLQKNLAPVFELVGISGNVTVKPKKDADGEFFVIKVGDTYEFTAFSPVGHTNSPLSITLVEMAKELESGIRVNYTETLVLTPDTYTPFKFVIHQYPQTQTTYLMDDTYNQKGDITYRNSCHWGGSFMILDTPVFNSKLVDLSRILDC